MSTTTYPVTWDLDSIMPHPETSEFGASFETYESELRELASASQQLPRAEAGNAEQWSQFLEAYQSVTATYSDLWSFIGCHAAADADNKLFQQMESRLAALSPLHSQISTNVEFALKEITDEELSQLFAADPRLREIEFYLHDARRHAEMRLPKDQEQLAAELDVDGIHAWGRLYDRISGALRVQLMERGELVEKSVGQVQYDSPLREVRMNNWYAANKSWSTIADTCADAINHIAGTRLTKYRHLGFEDHLVAPCRHNRMRRETLNTMWDVVRERKSCLLDYMQAKAKAFGVEKLAMFDLMAPYPVNEDAAVSKVPYDDACNLIFETFGEFSPEFGDFARQAIDQRWVEVENRAGKRQGGFCTDVPCKKESRIFMTYTDSSDSMSTLAHELGHAYHTYALRDQPFFLTRYPMNLAETASTFAEAVLGERCLEQAETQTQQIKILDRMLSDAMAFLMNIHARFIFEDRFHIERANGELTTEKLSELMTAAQREAYLDGLSDDGWYPEFWVSKLHFYITELPFYNFPYTFGYLLSLGLYSMGADGNSAAFAEQYDRFLIATGCQETEEAVQSTLGYDLTQREFWEKSLDVVARRVEQFVALTS